MPRALSRLLVTTVCVSLLALAVGGTAALSAKKHGHGTGSSLKALVKRTGALPRKALSKAKRLGLEKAAKDAKLIAGKRPCRAVGDLSRYRRILLGVKVKKGKRQAKAARKVAALGPLSLKASSSLLAGKRTKRCGGGTKLSTLSAAKTKVLKSDVNGMKLRVQLPAPKFVARTGGGKTWTQMLMPNMEATGTPGKPGIPIAGNVIGVPDGAKVIVKAGHVNSYTLDGVNAYPAQPDADDAVTKAPNFAQPPFTNKSFAFDPKAYNTGGPVPPKPADGGILGLARDVTIGNLTVPGAQYNPKTDQLKVLTSVEVDVSFDGGTHAFSPELTSPWEQPQRSRVAALLNAGIINSHVFEIFQPCGEEMLVITNPATQTAAETFATARRGAGLRTRVVQVGTGAGQIGSTATAIQAYIRGQLTSAHCIHPSYITIMGDDELVPTFTDGPGGIPSDLKYSMRDDADELPDVAIGRILGDGQGQVGAAVAKIVGYEAAPPGGPEFLNHATLAAMFQDTESGSEVNDGQEVRTFTQFAETVRNGLARRGVTVDRVYTDDPTTEPKKFNDGTSLPASLQKPTFPWNGTGADVSADWNAGRFLIIHRDHGWSDGWGDPFFTTSDVEALKNGSLLPVVMSINCASAEYDNDENSFVQQALVKPDGGAVGVFGDTRNSPSWHNSQIGLGFVDALLPSVLPSEGPATAQRMGDALVSGKLRLAGISPPSGPGISGGDGNTRNELYLWHFFGDPSMQMWGGGHAPIIFNPELFKAVFQAALPGPKPEPEPFSVVVSLPRELAGQPISLLQNGQVVGKALAGDGSVKIPALFGDGSVKPGDLKVAVEADGAQPVSVPVAGVPKVPTTLKQVCPRGGTTGKPLTVTGTLSGAPAGSQVDVTFTPPKQSGSDPTVVHATTQADGSWQGTVTPTPNEPGTWSASSHYAGTTEYAESSGEPCTMAVGSPPPVIE